MPSQISNPRKTDIPEIVQSTLPVSLDLKDSASKAEYETIMHVLREVNFNKSKAAEVLQIDRKTLYNKIKNYEDSQA